MYSNIKFSSHEPEYLKTAKDKTAASKIILIISRWNY
jgi:hypothetical protein